MKQFIDELIGRLDEKKGKVIIDGKEMYQEDYFIDIDDAIKIVNQLAEEYKGGWIPCSERFPERRKNLLVCLKSGYVGEGFFMQDEFWNTQCCMYGEVVAWMPLPAPYQKEGE